MFILIYRTLSTLTGSAWHADGGHADEIVGGSWASPIVSAETRGPQVRERPVIAP
jgi:hypothetical protein